MSKPLGTFDLTQHSIDDIPGKTVNINGQLYEFGKLWNEGGTSLVYPLKNVQSKLVRFLAKLLKFKPGHEQYESLAERMRNGEYAKMGFALESIPGGPREELYEIGGGLIRFQVCLGKVDNPEYQNALMQQAHTLLNQRRLEESAAVYDQVLAVNSFHTDALANKAYCVGGLGDAGQALHLVETAVEVEPNDSRLHRVGARIAVGYRMPLIAISFLRRALARYKWDYDTSELLANIAVDFDLVELADNLITEVLNAFDKIDKFRELKSKLEESIKRREKYLEHLDRAAGLAKLKDWNGAARECKLAEESSLNNSLAILNYCVCMFHAGQGRDVAQEAATLLYKLPPRQFQSCALLAALCFSEAEDLKMAQQLMFMLQLYPETPIDMPGIPIFVLEQMNLEEMSVQKVIEMLSSFGKDMPSEETEKVKELIRIYKEYEKITSK